MRRREVLPLQADVGQLLLDGLDELVDKVEIGLPGDALVAPADVLGVVESLGVVGPDVEHDGQGPFGANAADERVKRELADRNAEAAGPLVADAQDPLAVGDDDHIHLVMGAIAQERRDCVTQRVRDDEAARPTINVAELLARQRHHRRIDHRSHFLDVLQQQRVEQDLIRVLQGSEINVPLEVFVLASIRLVGANQLLVERLDHRRQQPVQPKVTALGLRKGRPLVQSGTVEQADAPGAVMRSWNRGHGRVSFCRRGH